MSVHGKGYKWIRPWKRCAIYARDEFRCVYCSLRTSKLTLDHVEPEGGNDTENLVTSCLFCNMQKGDKTLREWAHYRATVGWDDPPDWLSKVRQRVAIATFLPIDPRLGKTLEASRLRGRGSYPKLAKTALRLMELPKVG